MFPLGTFPSSSVLEQDPQIQTEVVSDADPLYIYTPGLNSAVAASPGCEVLSSPQ